MLRRSVLLVGILLSAGPVRAEDFEAGKSGPKIFETDCAACHHSAKGLAKGQSARAVADFLRSHYTTGPGPAGSVADYLVSVGAGGRAAKPAETPPPRPDKPVRQPPQEGRSPTQESRKHQRSTPDHEGAAEPAEQGVLSGAPRGARRPRPAPPPDQVEQTSPSTDEQGARAGSQPSETGAQADRKRRGPAVSPEDVPSASANVPSRRDARRSNGKPPAGVPEALDRHPDPVPQADPNARSVGQTRPAAATRVPEPEIPPLPKLGPNGAGVAREGTPVEPAAPPAEEGPATTAAQFPEGAGSRGSSTEPASRAEAATPGDQATFSAPLP